MTTQAREPLDADLAAYGQRLKDAGVDDLYSGGNGPASRAKFHKARALMAKPVLPEGKIENLTIDGPHGPIPIRVLWPPQGEPIGTLVFFHGGGFVVGDLETHHMHCLRFASRARLVVVNVNYRHAPEHPFPQGIDDAFAATKWASEHLARLGGAKRPLAVSGDSAGGNLTAVTAIACRDAGIKLAAQAPTYPVTDMTKSKNPDIRKAYFGDKAATLSKDWRASPILADLKGVAPTILTTGAHDFLYEDNMAYAAKLRAANVPLVLRVYPTFNHGFMGCTGISKAADAAADRLCNDLLELMTR